MKSASPVNRNQTIVSRVLGAEALAVATLVFSASLTVGCGSAVSDAITPEAASAAVMERFDANHDGSLDKQEFVKCPPLVAAAKSIDTDANVNLSIAEISSYLGALAGPGSDLTQFSCTVVLDGRPLSGAKVVLRPSEIYGDAIVPAEGITDQTGVVQPTIPPDQLPAEFRHMPLVRRGLYNVEITSDQKQLQPRYNTATELGCVIGITSRDSANVRFDLKTN